MSRQEVLENDFVLEIKRLVRSDIKVEPAAFDLWKTSKEKLAKASLLRDEAEKASRDFRKIVFKAAEKQVKKDVECGSFGCKKKRYPWETMCGSCYEDYLHDPDAYK